MREFRLSIVRDNDRARRDAETDDERQHRLSRMRERETGPEGTQRNLAPRESTLCVHLVNMGRKAAWRMHEVH